MRIWWDARCCVPNLSAPPIILKTQTPLTKTEAIEALQAVLALNGIAVVNIGDKFVKVLPPDQAGTAGGAINSVPASQLPDLGTYVTHIVQLTIYQAQRGNSAHPSVRKTAGKPFCD